MTTDPVVPVISRHRSSTPFSAPPKPVTAHPVRRSDGRRPGRGPARVATRVRSGWRDERGEIESTVVMAPLAVLLVMTVVQAGILFHARTILTAAAQDGLRAAQLEGASSASGREAAQVITAGSTEMLQSLSIRVDRGVDSATVEVSAEVPSLVPFWDGRITSSATGPVERFRPETER